MSKIVLNDITNLNALSVINDNFDKIELEFQNKVLYRNNPVGEPNTLENDVDADGNDIFNVKDLSLSGVITIDGEDYTQIIQDSVDEAAASAALATSSAALALVSQNSATASASTASTAASNAASSAATAQLEATNSASSAASSANSATLATTKANEASASATTATTKAAEASASATTATTKASEASGYASTSLVNSNSAAYWANYSYERANEAQAYSDSALFAFESMRDFGLMTSLSVSGNTVLGDAVGDTVVVKGTTTFQNAMPTFTTGTANGVAYLNASKVLTTGSALTFDGGNTLSWSSSVPLYTQTATTGTNYSLSRWVNSGGTFYSGIDNSAGANFGAAYAGVMWHSGNYPLLFGVNGSEGMRLTSTGLGIGTSSPASKLDVVGRISATNSQAFLFNGSTGTYGTFQYNGTSIGDIGTGNQVISGGSTGDYALSSRAGNLLFGINGSERARIDTSGNLGIGTSSPGSYGKLAVLAGSTVSVAYFDTTGSSSYSGSSFNNPLLTLRSAGNAAGIYQGIRFANSAIGTIEGSFGFVQNSGGYGDFVWQGYNGSYTERMRLDSSGNLGLGVTPSAWKSGAKAFQLGATGYASLNEQANGSTSLNFNCYESAANTWTYFVTGVAPTRYTQLSGSHQWFNAASGTAGNAITFTQAMTLDASGNLLVGTTSAALGYKLYLAPSGTYNSGIYYKSDANNTNAMDFRNTSDTQVGSIYVSTSNTVFATTSDYRLKTVIAPVSDSGSRIDALEPVEYEWKDSGERTRGFLAHKFQEVYPSSVTGTKDAMDADNNPVYQAMQASTSEVIADLVAELQSLRARVAALES